MKEIAVFTSIRSEYGLLSPLLKRLQKHTLFNLKLLVGGAHLLESYGKTIKQIEADGFQIDEIFPFLMADEEKDTLCRSLANLQLQIGKYFIEGSVDLLIILGDRIELMPVATTALLYGIPITHISGGETTEGAIDNQVRHALTKLSHIHFPATQLYAENIIKMGEEPWRVLATGEPGLDLINEIELIGRDELYDQLGLDKNKEIILSTFHPETIDGRINKNFVEDVFRELITQGYQIIVTASNFDEGGNDLNRKYEELSNNFLNQIIYVPSLGQLRYYSLMKYAYVMLGNSSSGPVEAQSFNLPVINVGSRQAGRLFNPNIITVSPNVEQILLSLEKLNDPDFKEKYFNKPNFYGDGHACDKMISYLEGIEWSKLFLKKDRFED